MTKKLVTILAEEFPEWLFGGNRMSQNMNGLLKTSAGIGYAFFELSEDYETANVTRAQWEAERARILLESQPERDADVAKVVDGVAARSAEDQALWEKVYFRAWELIAMDERELEYIMRAAANAADAFMAERAKRMKG